MTTDDKLVRRAVQHVQGAAGKPYLPEPIPNALDQAVSALTDAFIAGSEAQRRGLSGLVTGKSKLVLRSYAERMASLGVRTRQRKDLLRGLAALGMVGFWEDPRDDLPILSLHWAAAKKIGVEGDKLFREAAALSVHDDVAKELRAFPGRAPEDQSIEAMGYAEETARDGFRFQRQW